MYACAITTPSVRNVRWILLSRPRHIGSRCALLLAQVFVYIIFRGRCKRIRNILTQKQQTEKKTKRWLKAKTSISFRDICVCGEFRNFFFPLNNESQTLTVKYLCLPSHLNRWKIKHNKFIANK